MKNWRIASSLFGLALAGMVARLFGFRNVFVDGDVIFPGFDPYYHMRRIFEILHDYPNVPYFDSFMNYPDGAAIIWPPLFDFFIASASLMIGLNYNDTTQVETLAAWIIPVMGCATIIPVYFLAKSIFDEKHALLAAALFIFIPMHTWYSQLGFVDHHVAVTLVQVTMFALFIKALQVCRGDEGSTLRLAVDHFFLISGATLSIVAGFLIWNGFIFFLGIMDIFLLTLLFTEGIKPGSKIPALCWTTHLAAGLILLPFTQSIVAATGNPVTAITLSYFHIGAIFSFAAVGIVTHIIGLGPLKPLGDNKYGRAIILFSIAVVIYAAYATGALSEGLAWIMTSDKFMAAVDESSPIFIKQGKFDLIMPVTSMTAFFITVPFVIALLAWQWRNGRYKDSDQLFLILWSGILFLMTVKQRRFADPFSPAQAILISYFLFQLYGRITVFFTTRGAHKKLAAKAAFLTLAIISVLAYGSHYKHLITRQIEMVAQPMGESDDYHVRVYRSLKSFKKTLDASPAGKKNTGPVTGVMNPWSLGHKILYITHLPVVSNNFGSHIGKDSYSDWASFFMGKKEEVSTSVLDKRKVKYVVVDFNLGVIASATLLYGERAGSYYKGMYKHGILYQTIMKPALIRTTFFRLSRFIGSETVLKNAKGGKLFIPALDHFRMIVDSTMDNLGHLKVFEYVKGASLSIKGPPGQKVAISYDYTSSTGRERTYKKTVLMDDEGRGMAVLPYSSNRPGYGHTAPYHFEVNGVTRKVEVMEKDVLGGGMISVNMSR
ncbi:hypothetical protein MNBD_NITROSPINAE03-1533 [hydrothermal vent metagenome]|uniref:Uncharacterized protein n=1 Tax=hydrothermal vent metagenome TaxID=652676 RepID=A0A3B1CXX7_9ZZZZ